jgi:hypothetical protein
LNSRQQQGVPSKEKNLIIKEKNESRKSYEPFSEEAKKKYLATIENGRHDMRPAASAKHGKEGTVSHIIIRGSMRGT